MKQINQKSDQLLNEIMQLEVKINKIMALNGNQENSTIQRYRQFILAKKNKLERLSDETNELTDL